MLARWLLIPQVRLTNSVASSLPYVAADRTKLQQIFFNLIGNAARFTHVSATAAAGPLQQLRPALTLVPDAHRALEPSHIRILQAHVSPASSESCIPPNLSCMQTGYIKVGARVMGDQVEMYVQDTGIGVPQDKMDAIFQPYDQVGSIFCYLSLVQTCQGPSCPCTGWEWPGRLHI